MHPQRFMAAGAALVSVLSLAVLTACGGGRSSDSSSSNASSSSGSGSTATTASVKLSTYITDNLTTDYSQVWVGIKSITAIDGTGSEVTLYTSSDTSGYTTVDLRSLASVGQLLSSTSIPSGTYTQIKVTLDDEVTLVKASDGSSISAFFTSDASDKVVHVSVTLDTTTSSALVLDFNLDKFTYNATTNLVTPDVARKDDSSLKTFKAKQGDVHGSVAAIDTTARTITVTDARLGSGTVLQLTSDAVITRESDGTTIELADLTAGTKIEAKGVVTSASTDSHVTVQVSAVRIESTSSSASSSTTAVQRYRGEGTVTAVSGNTVTLSLTDANFLPSSTSVNIDVSSAKYAHGTASDLATGITLSFSASYDTSTETYTAKVIDIAGGTSAKERQSDASKAASKATEVDGTVTAISDTTWTVTALKTHGSVTSGSSYTVDVSNALMKANSSCVAVGSRIEARGTLSGTALTAKVVKLKSECSTSSSSTSTSTTS